MPPDAAHLLVAIETSSPVGSVAALLAGLPAAEERFEKGMRHGRELVPRLARMCERLDRAPRTIDVVAVSIGPGSYTGLRVGVTCAKTLAFAVGAALVPVSTLAVVARNADPEAPHVAVLADARREQVYAAFFDRRNGDLERRDPDAVLDPADVLPHIRPGTLVIGDAPERYEAALRQPLLDAGARFAPAEAAVPRASQVALLGWHAFRAGRTADPHDIVPRYLRRPEAVNRLEARRSRQA